MIVQRRPVLWTAVLVAAGCSVWFATSQPPRAPSLFAIELSFTPGVFAQRLGAWIAAFRLDHVAASGAVAGYGEAVSSFRRDIVIDFAFIPAYAIVLAALHWWLAHTAPQRVHRIVPAACATAALADLVENALLLWLIRPLGARAVTADDIGATAVRAMSSVSAIKWAALTLVAVFIVRAFAGGQRGRVLILSRYSLVSMALGTVPLVATGQGRDLIAALGDRDASAVHRTLFFVTLALWSLSVWYWTRVVLDAELARQDPTYRGLARHLPRMSGVLTLLLPAIPIASAVNDAVTKAALTAGCGALAALFWVFVTRRRRWLPTMAGGPALSSFSPADAWRAPAGRIAVAALTLSLLLFVWFVAAPLATGSTLGALPIIFIAAANTVFFGNVAVFTSGATGVRLDLVAFACAAAFSFWNDNHDVRVRRHRGQPLPIERVFSDWLEEVRPGEHGHAGQPRVFLVAAEGGGIRAAYWTAKVLSALSDADADFGPHVFAISGISGGSLGAAVYAALRRDVPQRLNLQAHSKEILGRGDFLAPVLALLVTGDFVQWFIPLPVHLFDRSRGMEEGFAAAYRRVARTSTFDDSFFDLAVSGRNGVPALVLTAASVERGARMVTAPFTWTRGQIPDARDYRVVTGNGAPTLAAAVHNSARFTYVSPAGLVRSVDEGFEGHVVDGGYFDPSGADTLLDISRALEPVARGAGVQLVPLFITNGRISPAAPPVSQERRAMTDAVETTDVAIYGGELQAVKILGELFAPLRAVLAARDAHARVAIARQQQAQDAIAFGFCDAVGGPREPPLGWQLSPPMVEQLDRYWAECPVNEIGRKAVASALVREARGGTSR